MADFFSVEQTIEEAGRRKGPADQAGKMRVLMGTAVTHATLLDMAIGEVLIVGMIPKLSRILPGHFVFGAMGAGATADIGTYTRVGSVFTAVSEAKYLAAADVATASHIAVANTAVLNFLDKLTEDLWIGIQAEGADWADGIAFSLFLPYVSA